jgi:hypothetical protein
VAAARRLLRQQFTCTACRVGFSPLDLKLQAGSARLGAPPADCPEDDPRQVLAEAVGFVRNNRSRRDYPR